MMVYVCLTLILKYVIIIYTNRHRALREPIDLMNKDKLLGYVGPTIYVVAAIMVFTATALELIRENKHQDSINDKKLVERVFMHQPGDYSVVYREDESRLDTIRIRKYSSDLYSVDDVQQVIYADVEPGKPIYLLFKGKYNGLYQTNLSAEIHIHSSQEINGAEWETGGKYPRKNQTVPVE